MEIPRSAAGGQVLYSTIENKFSRQQHLEPLKQLHVVLRARIFPAASKTQDFTYAPVARVISYSRGKVVPDAHMNVCSVSPVVWWPFSWIRGMGQLDPCSWVLGQEEAVRSTQGSFSSLDTMLMFLSCSPPPDRASVPPAADDWWTVRLCTPLLQRDSGIRASFKVTKLPLSICWLQV